MIEKWAKNFYFSLQVFIFLFRNESFQWWLSQMIFAALAGVTTLDRVISFHEGFNIIALPNPEPQNWEMFLNFSYTFCANYVN